MYHFSYPSSKWDEKNLDKTAILTLIKKHEVYAGKLYRCMEYYTGKHDILRRRRADNVPNNKVVCNHAKDITDTATGYFMGNPITYANSTGADIEPLLKAYDNACVDDVDADNALSMSIYGKGFEYVYAKKDEATPISKSITPTSSFMIIDTSIEENELAGVYYYKQKDSARDTYIYVATVATANLIYELNIEDSESIAQQVTESPRQHYFGEVPIIEYLNNREGMGDFEQQIPLIDAYNTLMSDRVNDKEQFIDSILVIYGALMGDDRDETEAAQKKLQMDKLLELPEDAKAEYLSRQLDESGVEVLRKAIKEDIYTFSHVPNLSDENFAGNSSGVAMEYKLLGLEMLTKIKERYYKKGLRKRIRLYCNFLNMKAIAVDSGSIMETFSRSLPKNLVELSQIVANLKDRVSEQTLLKQIPFVEDPDYEIKEVTKQKQEAVKQQQEAFSVNPNTPPQIDNTEDDETEQDNRTSEDKSKKTVKTDTEE